jgi:hypothetical protein
MSKVVRLFLALMVLVGAIALARLSAVGDRAGANQVAIRDEDFAGSQLPPK